MKQLSDGERAILCQDGPEDDGARVRVLSQRICTARKQHNCSVCPDGVILPGQRYERLTLLEEGEGPAFLTLCLPGECRESKGGQP